MKISKTINLFVVGCVHLGMATNALAQAPAILINEGASIMPWFIAGGIIGLICISGFLKSKRSHLN